MKKQVEVNVDSAIADLPEYDRALFGALMGAAESIKTHTMGIDLEGVATALRPANPESSRLAVMLALDRIQKVTAKVETDDGMFMVTHLLLVTALVQDAEGNAISAILYLPLGEV